MTDLEMTRLAAEAMGLRPHTWDDVDGVHVECPLDERHSSRDGVPMRHYDPLHDDAQCFALVKWFHIDCLWLPDERVWVVGQHEEERGYKCANLRRAIVEAVAKMQKGQSDEQR